MRTLFLLLLLGNLLLLAVQFDVVRGLAVESHPARPPAVNAERLRIIRDNPPRSAG